MCCYLLFLQFGVDGGREGFRLWRSLIVMALLLHSLSWFSTFSVYTRVTARHCHTHSQCDRSATTSDPSPPQSTYPHTQLHPSTSASTSRNIYAEALQPTQICLLSLVPASPRYAGHQADKPLEVATSSQKLFPQRSLYNIAPAI